MCAKEMTRNSIFCVARIAWNVLNQAKQYIYHHFYSIYNYFKKESNCFTHSS